MKPTLLFVFVVLVIALILFVYRYWPALAALWAAAWIIRTTHTRGDIPS